MNKPAIDRVYMDSCCFIEMAKRSIGKSNTSDSSKNDDVWFLRKICDASLAGDIQVITSTLSLAECIHVGNGYIDNDAKVLFEKFLTSGKVVIPDDADYFVAIAARDLYWSHGILLSGSDAIHVATAILTDCREFITTDKRLSKQKFRDALEAMEKVNLRVVRASGTKLLPMKYRQGEMINDS
jgi:predicted nucleic acid-binding protein